MSLKQWLDNGWLKLHKTSRGEIKNLLLIAERDAKDARESGLSLDWRFGIAYNAALKLCTALLSAGGYRPAQSLQHYRAIAALPMILGEPKKKAARYLEDCRRKRNRVEYDCIGGVSENEVKELISFVDDFRQETVFWLKEHHPELMD